MATRVARPPKRMVSSKAMMMKGGKDTGALPPVTSSHLSDDQMVRKKPVAVPVRAPIKVKSRTALTGRTLSISSSISSTGTGVYTVKSTKPRARKRRMASRVVSTWANTPSTLAVAILMTPRVGVLQRMGEGLLHLHDGQRRQHPDAAQEEEEEPGEGARDDGGVGHRRIVRAPGVRIEIKAQPRHDDVEPLQPHADEDEDGDDEQPHRVEPDAPPEEHQRGDAVAEIHAPVRPRVLLGRLGEHARPLEVVTAVPGGEHLAEVEVA